MASPSFVVLAHRIVRQPGACTGCHHGQRLVVLRCGSLREDISTKDIISLLGELFRRRHAASPLSISSQKKLFSKIATFATETSIHYILNVLFSAYFARNFQENFKSKAGLNVMEGAAQAGESTGEGPR